MARKWKLYALVVDRVDGCEYQTEFLRGAEHARERARELIEQGYRVALFGRVELRAEKGHPWPVA